MSEPHVMPALSPSRSDIPVLLCPALGCVTKMAGSPCNASMAQDWRRCAAPPADIMASNPATASASYLEGDTDVCSYGPSTLTLTIVFSGAALVLFGERGLSPTQAAVYAAQWALLSGQVAGTVHMFLESPALSRCYEHFHVSQTR